MSMLVGLDIANAASYNASLVVARRTASANGAAIDTSAIGEPVIAVVAQCSAAAAGTNPTATFTLEHSEDNSSWGAVPAAALTDADGAADTFDQVTTTASVQVLALRKQLLKRYVRAVITIGGTSTPTFDAGVMLVGVKRSFN